MYIRQNIRACIYGIALVCSAIIILVFVSYHLTNSPTLESSPFQDIASTEQSWSRNDVNSTNINDVVNNDIDVRNVNHDVNLDIDVTDITNLVNKNMHVKNIINVTNDDVNVTNITNVTNDDVNVTNITDVVKDAVDAQRLLIAEEMHGYNYPSGRYNITAPSLAELTPETGGRPVRTIIISTWRSGSTFFGEIINSHPGNFYHYEPLLDYGIVQIRDRPLATRALKELRSLLECDFSAMNRYLKNRKLLIYIFTQNTRLWEQCKLHPNVCWQPYFLTPFCRLFPFQSMKILRLRLNLVEELLEDPSLNVRVVYLVRDPRGTHQSRKHQDWCPGNPDCMEPERLCTDLENDYGAAVSLSAKYPNRFRVIRYEELSVEPITVVQELFKIFGLDFHENVQKFLETHTKVDVGKYYSTYRISKSTPFHWRQDLTHAEVQTIQRSCAPAMDLWGYIQTFNSSHQKEFNPVGGFEL